MAIFERIKDALGIIDDVDDVLDRLEPAVRRLRGMAQGLKKNGIQLRTSLASLLTGLKDVKTPEGKTVKALPKAEVKKLLREVKSLLGTKNLLQLPREALDIDRKIQALKDKASGLRDLKGAAALMPKFRLAERLIRDLVRDHSAVLKDLQTLHEKLRIIEGSKESVVGGVLMVLSISTAAATAIRFLAGGAPGFNIVGGLVGQALYAAGLFSILDGTRKMVTSMRFYAQTLEKRVETREAEKKAS